MARKPLKKVLSNQTSKIEGGVKKLKKKNNSITRQQLIAADKTQDSKQASKKILKLVDERCNTHRSVSRPKSGFSHTQSIDVPSITERTLGGRKPSQISMFGAQNKENIKPVTKGSKVSTK